MTPERAAQVLGVAVDADRSDVEHAFQRRARATHPDAVGPERSDGESGAAFREVAEARRVLLTPPVEAPALRIVIRDGARLQGPVLTATWTGLLLLAAFLAIFRAPYPLTIAEPLIHWAVLIAAAIGFALSGRRPLAVVAVAAEVATVAMTIAATTFGGLIALLITLPALLGAFTGGIARHRLRRDAVRARG